MTPQSELMRLVHRVALVSERVGERAFQSEAGIGRATYLVLRTIADADGPLPSQQALADRIGLGKAIVSRHVATASANGWLTTGPSPVSRRERALAISDEGRRVVARGRVVQRRLERSGAERLEDAAVDQAIEVLTTVCDLLDEQDRGVQR